MHTKVQTGSIILKWAFSYTEMAAYEISLHQLEKIYIKKDTAGQRSARCRWRIVIDDCCWWCGQDDGDKDDGGGDDDKDDVGGWKLEHLVIFLVTSHTRHILSRGSSFFRAVLCIMIDIVIMKLVTTTEDSDDNFDDGEDGLDLHDGGEEGLRVEEARQPHRDRQVEVCSPSFQLTVVIMRIILNIRWISDRRITWPSSIAFDADDNDVIGERIAFDDCVIWWRRFSYQEIFYGYFQSLYHPEFSCVQVLLQRRTFLVSCVILFNTYWLQLQ